MSISTDYTDSSTSVHTSVCAPKCNAITTVALAILALGTVLTVAGLVLTSPVVIPGIILLAVGGLMLSIGCCIPSVSISSRTSCYDDSASSYHCHNTGVAYVHNSTPNYVVGTSARPAPYGAPSSREVGGQGNPLRGGTPARVGLPATDIRARGNAHGGAVVVETRR